MRAFDGCVLQVSLLRVAMLIPRTKSRLACVPAEIYCVTSTIQPIQNLVS